MFEREVCAEGWVIVIIGRGLYRVPRFSSHKSRSERSLIFPQTHPFVNFCQPLPATSPRRSLRGYKISKKKQGCGQNAKKMQKRRQGKSEMQKKFNAIPKYKENAKKMQKKINPIPKYKENAKKCKKNAKIEEFLEFGDFFGKMQKNAKKYKKNAKKMQMLQEIARFLDFLTGARFCIFLHFFCIFFAFCCILQEMKKMQKKCKKNAKPATHATEMQKKCKNNATPAIHCGNPHLATKARGSRKSRLRRLTKNHFSTLPPPWPGFFDPFFGHHNLE